MSRSVLVSYVAFLIACLLVCPGGNVAIAASPVRTRGEVVLEGSTVKYETEYWGDECMVKDNKLTAPGLHDIYYDVIRRISGAVTMDEARSLWDSGSWNAEREKDMNEMIEDNLKNHVARRHPDERIYMSVMTECNGNKDLFVMVSGPLRKTGGPQQGFDIQCLSFRDGRWKYSAVSLDDHPVRKELQLGAWKQFGSPVDIGNPERKRKILQRYLATTRAAATQKTTKTDGQTPEH